MHWQTERAAARLAATGMITVIVQDNHPIHTSRGRACWQQWQEQGMYLFELPKYSSSQMNLIKPEWHQLKTHKLAGRIFEDEYDLVLAVMAGVEARVQGGQYAVERFLFNSA